MELITLIRKFKQYWSTHGLRNSVIKAANFLVTRALLANSEFQTLREVKAKFADLQKNNFETVSFLATWIGNNAHLLKTEKVFNPPLISIIMPTLNRGFIIENAIQSVLNQTYQNWELLIVDNGSTDNTNVLINRYLADKRIVYLSSPVKENVSAARNFGLSKSNGEIIVYHDTDITWYPHFLNTVSSQFQKHPEKDSCYLAQFIANPEQKSAFLRGREFSSRQLCAKNFIDLNVFAHRRTLWLQCGGFDENMSRLVDWDLILRYTKHQDPLYIKELAGNYIIGPGSRITNDDSYFYNHYLLKRKHEQQVNIKVCVLYAVFHYPQLTESYIETEILYMRKLGFTVQVWSQLDIPIAAPYPSEVEIFYGDLGEVIKKTNPDLIHIHWLHTAWEFRDILAKFSIPVTVRSHGFEVNSDLIKNLQADATYKSIYLFPHFYAASINKHKLASYTSAFDPVLFYPQKIKNKRLVLRTGCALDTKDYETYMQVARACPHFKFVLIIGRAQLKEYVADEIIARNHELGNPVEILINVQRPQVAELMRAAAIYLHTHVANAIYGMPISIAEALAAGCYVVARKFPSNADYIGTSGDTYTTVDEAVQLIKATENWTEEMWQKRQEAAVDYAYSRYLDSLALKPIVADWLKILQKTSSTISQDFIEEYQDSTASVDEITQI